MGEVLMNKNIYIFNCKDSVDPLSVANIYDPIARIASLTCNKYTCVFCPAGESSKSRSGSVKNVKTNFARYLSEPQIGLSSESFCILEIFDQPKGVKRWEHEKISCGFYAERLIFIAENRTTNFYLVTSINLSMSQICDLWNCLSTVYFMNYMVSFSLDTTQHPEVSMYGTPMYGPNTSFSDEDIRRIKKIGALRKSQETFELEDIFPFCITTNSASVYESAYTTKKSIDLETYAFVK